MSVTQSVILMIFLLSFVKISPEYSSLIYGKTACLGVVTVGVVWYMVKLRMLDMGFGRSEINAILKFSLPTVVFSLSTLYFNSIDRIMINDKLGESQLGIYTAIFQIASLINLIAVSFNAAWMPWLFEQLKDESMRNKIKIVRFNYLMIIGVFVCAAIFALIFPFISGIMLIPEYVKYNYIATPLILAQVFQLLYLMVSPYVFYGYKSKYNGIIGITAAVGSTFFNYYLIPAKGLEGAAYASVFTWMLLFVMFFIAGQMSYKMPWLKSLKLTK